jgi:hypothetical protein
MNNCNLALKGRNTLALKGRNTLAPKGRYPLAPKGRYPLALKGQNIIKTLPHQLITATDIRMINTAFEQESSRYEFTQIVGSDETAAVEVG